MVAKKNKAKAVIEEAGDQPTADGYDELLSKAYGSIPKEQMLPEGTWRLKVRGYKYRPATETASAQVVFFLMPIEPKEDVDTEALEALGEDYDLSINSATAQFWLGEARDWTKVFAFAEAAGIESEEVAEVSRKEVFDMIRDRYVVGYMKVETYTDRAGAMVQKLVVSSFSKDED